MKDMFPLLSLVWRLFILIFINKAGNFLELVGTFTTSSVELVPLAVEYCSKTVKSHSFISSDIRGQLDSYHGSRQHGKKSRKKKKMFLIALLQIQPKESVLKERYF